MKDTLAYNRGFEDALELCLADLEKTKTLEEAREKVRCYLGLVKENKLERLRKMLWIAKE